MINSVSIATEIVWQQELNIPNRPPMSKSVVFSLNLVDHELNFNGRKFDTQKTYLLEK